MADEVVFKCLAAIEAIILEEDVAVRLLTVLGSHSDLLLGCDGGGVGLLCGCDWLWLYGHVKVGSFSGLGLFVKV